MSTIYVNRRPMFEGRIKLVTDNYKTIWFNGNEYQIDFGPGGSAPISKMLCELLPIIGAKEILYTSIDKPKAVVKEVELDDLPF